MINNIGNILKQAELTLINSNIYKSDFDSTAKLDANLLLAHVLTKPIAYLHTWPEQTLSIGQVAMFWALIDRRCNGEPIAYITGQKEFFSLNFKVNKHTLIPRPETEILVELALEKFKDASNNNINILDLGTGSGAIAIALAKSKPSWQVAAVDNSELALRVAKDNANLNNISNINFILSDWFSNLEQQIKYDCIVSNPPYIDDNNPDLINGDLKFEPKSALLASNKGLFAIEFIITKAKDYLKPGGILILEHGYDQLAEIKLFFSRFSAYSKFEAFNDYAGLPRVVSVICN